MVVNWKAVSIESDNFMLMLIALFATYRVISWRVKNHLSPFVSDVVTSWAWVFGAIGINRGWFALSRELSADGARWQPFMFEWRWVVIMLTTMACSWGLVSFVQLIDEFTDAEKYGLFAVVYALSRLMGYY